MFNRKAFMIIIMTLGISFCLMPVHSQSRQKQDQKLKVKKPMTILLKPDLQVDKVEFSGYKLKVWIKNTGLVNAPGPHIKAKITVGNRVWEKEKSIINRVGQPGAVIPTKKPSDRAYVIFDTTNNRKRILFKNVSLKVVLDSTNKVKESNEANNIYTNKWEMGDGVIY